MGRNNRARARQRSQLPKNRGEFFASFGFRHELKTHNPSFYGFLEALDERFNPKTGDTNPEERLNAKVLDPSKLSLKIVERYSMTNASRRGRVKLNKSEVSAIKQDVRLNIGALGLDSSGISVDFDRIVPVGDNRNDGDRSKFGLAPRIDQDSFEVIMSEFGICTKALHRWGIPELRFPDAEWVPHMTSVLAREDPRKVGTVIEETLDMFGGMVTLNFDPLQYYDEKTESMV